MEFSFWDQGRNFMIFGERRKIRKQSPISEKTRKPRDLKGLIENFMDYKHGLSEKS